MSQFWLWLHEKWWFAGLLLKINLFVLNSALNFDTYTTINSSIYLNINEFVVNITVSVLIFILMNMLISCDFSMIFHRWAHPLDHCQGLAKAQFILYIIELAIFPALNSRRVSPFLESPQACHPQLCFFVHQRKSLLKMVSLLYTQPQAFHQNMCCMFGSFFHPEYAVPYLQATNNVVAGFQMFPASWIQLVISIEMGPPGGERVVQLLLFHRWLDEAWVCVRFLGTSNSNGLW